MSVEELKKESFPCARCTAKTLGMRVIEYYMKLGEGKITEYLCEKCFTDRKAKQETYWRFSMCGVVPELL